MWKGFLTESKSFMGYPQYGRVKFYLRYPSAAIKFYFYTAKDTIARYKSNHNDSSEPK